MKVINKGTQAIIAAAIEVHRHLGPGLLESVYQVCLMGELRLRGPVCALEVPVPIVYKGNRLGKTMYIDMLVADCVIVEAKATEKDSKLYAAQLLSYLKLADIRMGLVLNFGLPTLAAGIQRVRQPLVARLYPPSTPEAPSAKAPPPHHAPRCASPYAERILLCDPLQSPT